jgi:chromosomal replication initiator protein
MRAAPVVAEPETIPEPTAQIEPPRAVPIPEDELAPGESVAIVKVRMKLSRHDVARAVVAATAKHFGITVEELRSERRRVKEVFARYVAARLIYDITGMSTPQIGIKLGGKDHSSVIHGLHRAKELLETDPSFVKDYEAVKALIEPVAP